MAISSSETKTVISDEISGGLNIALAIDHLGEDVEKIPESRKLNEDSRMFCYLNHVQRSVLSEILEHNVDAGPRISDIVGNQSP